jgi:hypothetical protein
VRRAWTYADFQILKTSRQDFGKVAKTARSPLRHCATLSVEGGESRQQALSETSGNNRQGGYKWAMWSG